MPPNAQFINWQSLQNPVLAYPDWSIKDFACGHRDGVFFVAFSAFFEIDGVLGCKVIGVSTTDFYTFSDPIVCVTGQSADWRGAASPDIIFTGEEYLLTFNSWGDKPGLPNQLFYLRSLDLQSWSEPHPLAANLTAGNRAIDAALTVHNDRFTLIWKDQRHVTRIATVPTLDADFTLIGDGAVSFHMADGTITSRGHENYQFLQIEGRWHMLATFFKDAHLPWLYALSGDPDSPASWQSWVDGRALNIAPEAFNTVDRANAAALYDWRSFDGYCYLLYAGNTEKKRFGGDAEWGRGWNRLGLARSRDLIRWSVAGENF